MLYKDVPFETVCSSMCITLWIYMRSPMQMIACAAASIRTGHDITYRGHTARLRAEGEGCIFLQNMPKNTLFVFDMLQIFHSFADTLLMRNIIT